MKKFLIFNLIMVSFVTHAKADEQVILCTGATNDNALLEIKITVSSDQSRIKIDDTSFNLLTNSEYALSWSNVVDSIRYDNYLSKITGNLSVVATNPEEEQSSLRANLICVQEKNKVIN